MKNRYLTALFLSCVFSLNHVTAASPRAAWEPNTDELRLSRHAIIVDGDGCAMFPVVKPGNGKVKYLSRRMKSEEPGEDRSDFERYLQAMFEHIAKVKPKRVVIYVHGGMNFLNDTWISEGSIRRADELALHMSESETYVVSICWQSDPFAAYSDRLFQITSGVRDRMVLRSFAAPIILTSDVVTAAARYPETLYNIFTNDLVSMRPDRIESRFQRAIAQQKALEKGSNGSERKPIKSFFAGNERTRTQEAGDIARWVVSLPVKLITTPVVNVVGNNAWQMMLRRSRTLFDRESAYLNTEIDREIGRPGAVRMFFDRAAKRLKGKEGPKEGISLFGHSMGAIVSCNILREDCGREIRFRSIVFIAAACTQREFQASVVPYLRYWKARSPGNPPHFYNLCLNPDAEMSEIPLSFASVELAPRGSLLIWLDGVLDRPSSEGDRMFGRWDNSILYANSIAASGVGELVTFKTFGRDRVPGAATPRRYIDEPTSPARQKNPDRWIYTTKICPQSPLAKKSGPVEEPTTHGAFSRFDLAQEPIPKSPGRPTKAPNFSFWEASYVEPEGRAAARTRPVAGNPARP